MKLKEFFQESPKAALAFSGGVDSSYLLYAAREAGADVRPYFIQTAFQPEWEVQDVQRLGEDLNMKITVLKLDVLSDSVVAFYLKHLERVSARTVIHYHTLLHRALKYAVKIELIDANPVDKVDRPKAAPFVGSFYDSAEVQKLFEAAKGSKLEIPIFLGAFYGLRRSEAIGLKWDAIDFQNDTITIRHTVVSCYIDGKRVQKAQDITKTKSSMRTLPPIPAFKELLQHKKKQQDEVQRACNKSYNKDYLGYICVDEMGKLLSPHYLTEAFAKLLKKHGLRQIRYHDLRHSCASLLLANGVPMKQIQEWLGHSDFSTTANIYAHLECNSKRLSAAAMTNGLHGALNVIS